MKWNKVLCLRSMNSMFFPENSKKSGAVFWEFILFSGRRWPNHIGCDVCPPCLSILSTSFPGSSLYFEKVPWLSREWNLLNSPCGLAKSYSEGIVTFVIGVQCLQCSTKRLAPHLAEFFPSTVGRSLEFVAFKTFRPRTWN